MEEDTQSVIDNNNPAVSQTGERVDALDGIDDYLAQYESGHEPQKKVEPQVDNSVVIDWVKSQMAEKEQERYKDGIEQAVKTVKSAMTGVDTSDRIVRGLLHDLAEQNPKIRDAFNDRYNNPDNWNRILKAAAKEFAKEFEGPDPDLTKDRDAVASAVRSASTAKATPSEDQASFEKRVKGMGAAELDKMLREMG